jgi:Flp pilus assembly protein TadD
MWRKGKEGGFMGYEKLSLVGMRDEIAEASKGTYARKFCFFLGAGASKRSEIKTGQELVQIWDKKLEVRNKEEHQKWKAKLGVTDENKDQFYSQFYERMYHRCPRDGYNFLEEMMNQARPSIGYAMLTHILTKTPNKVVVTTNFDHLVENTIARDTGVIPLVVGHEALTHYVETPIGRPTILKIHRDLLFNPKSTEGELKELPKNWQEALGRVFTEYHPVFIGYAGNDRSVMKFLQENKEEFASGVWKFPYWLVYDEKKDFTDTVREFLENANGYLVPDGDFDRVMCLLSNEFGYKLPSKEETIQNAQARYDALVSDFNKYIAPPKSMAEEKPDAEAAPTAETAKAMAQANQQVASKSEEASLVAQANVFFADGEYEKAQELYRKLTGLKPKNAEYHNNLGVILYAMERYEEALAEMQKAVELEPDNALYHNNLGTTLHEMKRYKEALAEAQKAVELEPDNAQYHNHLSIILHKMERYEEALVEMRKTVDLEPDNAEYHYGLNVVLHQMKQHGEALAESQKAVDLEPDNALYHCNLGLNLQKMEQYEEALAESQKAVDLEPGNARYHYSLSLILRTLGRKKEADAELQRAHELDPDNPLYQ